MTLAVAVRCLFCGRRHPVEPLLPACPACRTADFTSNIVYEYDDAHLDRATLRRMLDRPDRTVWRWRELLPIDISTPVTLGEGGTPLLPLPALGRRLGVPRLLAKDESRNPTWSFKDRLASVAITKAVELRAKGIVAATTGNHGSATAAYAAKAGLPCVIFTTTEAPVTVTTLMRAFGARLLAVATSEERWRLVAECVERFGWFTTTNISIPPAGSPAVGIEGYKTIAYEIAEALEWSVPDVMVVPTSAGDGLIGLWRGFLDLRRLGLTSALPTLMAAEPYPSYSVIGKETHARGGDGASLPRFPERRSVAFNVGTAWPVYQAVYATSESGGKAIAVTEEEIVDAQLLLASTEGVFAEASSATALAAVKRLRDEGTLREDARVAVLLTSSGLKDPGAVAGRLAPVPTIEPSPDAVARALGIAQRG